MQHPRTDSTESTTSLQTIYSGYGADEIQRSRETASIELHEQSAAYWKHCCWMMLCIPNAMVQVPTLSLLWTASMCLCGMLADLESFDDDFAALKMAGCDNRFYCFMPFERMAITAKDDGICLPVASIYLHYGLCMEASRKVAIAHNQLDALDVIAPPMSMR
ncbi:MAG: hypothetical protein A3E82_05865 [Gammaproteobacteria bacterium RIFCSPHIGHO2_12_FULL_38_11]|nr:MAG: hypothetical protein A3E82_05865 [Gammaproteobacteria bacterium RIFCSPHIGHO2_12_FULL_38_11]